jgi:hypothetical protein
MCCMRRRETAKRRKLRFRAKWWRVCTWSEANGKSGIEHSSQLAHHPAQQKKRKRVKNPNFLLFKKKKKKKKKEKALGLGPNKKHRILFYAQWRTCRISGFLELVGSSCWSPLHPIPLCPSSMHRIPLVHCRWWASLWQINHPLSMMSKLMTDQSTIADDEQADDRSIDHCQWWGSWWQVDHPLSMIEQVRWVIASVERCRCCC